MNGDNNQNDSNRNSTPQPPPRSRSLLFWILIFGIGLMIAVYMAGRFEEGRRITVTEFWTYVDNNELTGTLVVKNDRIEGQLADGIGTEKGVSTKFYVEYGIASEENLISKINERLKEAGANNVEVDHEPDSWWSTYLPNLLLMIGFFALLWFLLFRRISGAAGGGGFLGNFGRSKHRMISKEQSHVTFDDVAGIEDAKDEVKEMIEFLKDPVKFSRLGGHVPRGVLLVGEPGTGKTLLAKSIAGEADVPFFSISGSDFVEMFVGVGASRVRDLFKQAKNSAPCIIFLDEIDAVGRRRGVGFNGGGHDEREQTLNAILVEMDGFESGDGVIVCAATNRADVLDPALTRPGRFDRQINVPLPDLRGRYEILKIYANKVTCTDDVDLNKIARGTPMFSGADLAALVNEAAIAATLAEKDGVEQEDLEEARDKVRWGRSRRRYMLDEKDRRITAFHEAGHALVQEILPDADPLHKVSIIPRGPMGGATFSLPERDRYMYSRKYCTAQMKVMFAGRISEELFCDDITSGAQNDISQATELAKKMVLDWGMSDRLGVINYKNDDQSFMPMQVSGREYSEKTAEVIDAEIRKLVNAAYDDARALIEEHRHAVERVAEALLKYETLSAEEVQHIMEGNSLDKPTVSDLLDAERQKAALDTPGAPADTPCPEPPPASPPLPEPG